MGKIKSTVCVTLDYDLVAEMKARDEKMSGTLNSLLKAYLNKDPEEEQKLKDLEEVNIEIAKLLGRLEEVRKTKKKIEEKEKKKDEEEREKGIRQDLKVPMSEEERLRMLKEI